MKRKESYRVSILILLSGSGGAALLFHFLDPGLATACGILSLAFAVLAYRAHKESRKALWFNLAFFIMVLALVEFALYLIQLKENSFQQHIHTERVYEVMDDAILGSRPIPASHRIARKRYKDSLVYEVGISINQSGWRVCPPCTGKANQAVLFFGNSLTFGEGVNDEEAMPYQFGLANAEQYCVYNFASHGWGPHQMLALIEYGITDSLVAEPVSHIVFQTLYPEHIRRMLGFYEWDPRGPRYTLNKEGVAVHQGQFDAHFPVAARPYLSARSYIYKRFLQHPWSIHDQDKALYTAVVLRSHQLMQARYPGSRFHVLLWDWSEGEDAVWFDAWREAGIEIHPIEAILPDGDKSNLAWKISPYDKHPNAATQERIASYLSKALQ